MFHGDDAQLPTKHKHASRPSLFQNESSSSMLDICPDSHSIKLVTLPCHQHRSLARLTRETNLLGLHQGDRILCCRARGQRRVHYLGYLFLPARQRSCAIRLHAKNLATGMSCGDVHQLRAQVADPFIKTLANYSI